MGLARFKRRTYVAHCESKKDLFARIWQLRSSGINSSYRVGIEVDYEQLPIPPIIRRFAKAFRYEPLRMISSGTLAVAVPPERVEGLCKTMEELETRIAFVSRVTEGAGVRVLRNGEVVHYTEIECEEDELARMWLLHPREK